MKTLIAIIALVVLPFYSMSINDPVIENEVRTEIKYSEDLRNNNIEGDVLVQFTVSKDGYVYVDQINSNDATLKNYVSSKLSSMVFEESDNERQYSMKFIFRLL
ncbi:MAG: hypothetical protein C0592_05660 [Marinilabiliales bacterium]|nr:MAG: hypothetical protein C0592_05660 [Marinilabiliales bacterium]